MPGGESPSRPKPLGSRGVHPFQPPALQSKQSKTCPQKVGLIMDSGRKEKRSPQKFRILLSNRDKPMLIASASTENVSTNSTRVQTIRPWNPNTRVLVK